MLKHNRKDLFPTPREVAELALLKEPKPPELPAAVVEALRRARDHFYRIAVSITDEAYDCKGNRDGVSIDCDQHAGDIDYLLSVLHYSAGSPGDLDAPYDFSRG
jgi:hypothetical protein